MRGDVRVGAWQASRGFTLVEMATVLGVIALLLGGLLVPLGTQMDASRYDRTRNQLQTAKDALVGFAIANNNRLPCPDSDADGLSDAAGCAALEGFLPFATLGVQQLDAWGNRLRYRADPNFTAALGIPNPPITIGGILVQSRVPVVALTAANPGAPAAVLFSCGKNGLADAANNGNDSVAAVPRCGAPVAPLDATYNQDVFVDGTFDDVLDWLSTQALLARLVSAGTWPG